MLRAFLKIFNTTRKQKRSLKPSNMRQSPRILMAVKCVVYDHAKLHIRKESLTRDMSFHGLCLETDFPVDMKDEFALYFAIGDREFWDVRADVTWAVNHKKGSRCGLCFDSATAPKIKTALLELLENTKIEQIKKGES
ncbi:PilZ domain-containing protein [Elusimicrobiota bacterium]